jgi:hypothetical protein
MNPCVNPSRHLALPNSPSNVALIASVAWLREKSVERIILLDQASEPSETVPKKLRNPHRPTRITTT